MFAVHILADMKKNVGNADKIIRLSIAIIIAVLYFTNVLSGTGGLIALIASGVLVLTAIISFCPLYVILGIRTCPRKSS